MRFGVFLRPLAAAGALIAVHAPRPAAAEQEHPVKRVANIVSVALDEYGKGVDTAGRLTSAQEYQEAVDFLRDAQRAAERLPGPNAPMARALLDSITAAVETRRRPAVLAELHKRFSAALGSDAALELPRSAIDLAAGRAIYERSCASCHGPRGLGDGPAAAGMNPKPPAVGSAADMHDRSPSLLFRIVSVGVAGTPMVGFASQLSAEERWNVVSYIASLRANPAQVAEGEGIFAQRCVQCHGALGAGDPALARGLSRVPPDVGSFAWQTERSDAQLATVIRSGLAGTPMFAARDLTDAEARSVVAYLRTLPLRDRNGGGTVVVSRDSGGAAAASTSLSYLEQSLTAARSGRAGDANDRAFDAYIAFEPIETPARARNPGVVASMEALYAEFKAAVRTNDIRGAERARDAIETMMPKVVELTRPTGSGFEAFLQSFLIILREGFEAILVIGAVVAILIKTGHRERLRDIWTGVALGLLASAITAITLKTLLGAMPASREIIEGLTMLVAVAVLFSVSYWLISRVEAAKWQQFIREKVSLALKQGGGRALAFVAFLAVYREGFETILFYKALFTSAGASTVPVVGGIAAGAIGLVAIYLLVNQLGLRVAMKPFFAVTGVMLYYMAFVFAGKGIAELQGAAILPLTVIEGAPRIPVFGIYPTVESLIVQGLLLVLAIVAAIWAMRSKPKPSGAAAERDLLRSQ